jgi:hypothetical protein
MFTFNRKEPKIEHNLKHNIEKIENKLNHNNED